MAQRTLKVKSVVVGQVVNAYIWTHPAKTMFRAEVLSNSIAGRKMKDATDADSVVIRNVDTDEVLTLRFAGGGAHITKLQDTVLSGGPLSAVETTQRVTFKVEVPDTAVIVTTAESAELVSA